jgi:hypothetical protein
MPSPRHVVTHLATGESEAEFMMCCVKMFMPPGDMVVVLYLAIVYIDP